MATQNEIESHPCPHQFLRAGLLIYVVKITCAQQIHVLSCKQGQPNTSTIVSYQEFGMGVMWLNK